MQLEPDSTSLGPPALKIHGFQLWVRGRQFPESTDRWDGNWLRVTAHCGAQGASVWTSGSILTTMDIEAFSAGCRNLLERRPGQASIHPVEPNLTVVLTPSDRLAHLELCVRITPDQVHQSHEMKFEIDQSFLPEIVSQCRKILEEFPVRA